MRIKSKRTLVKAPCGDCCDFYFGAVGCYMQPIVVRPSGWDRHRSRKIEPDGCLEFVKYGSAVVRPLLYNSVHLIKPLRGHTKFHSLDESNKLKTEKYASK